MSEVLNKNVPCSQTNIRVRNHPQAFPHYLFRWNSPVPTQMAGFLSISY